MQGDLDGRVALILDVDAVVVGTGAGGGPKPGAPGATTKPHPYAGDERLERVLAAIRSGIEPSAAGLAAEWNVSQRTAERIIRAARTLLQ